MTQPSPAPRFWPTAGPLGLAVIGLAVLTAISVRFAFRSALLYLIAVVFVSLTGDLAAAAGISLVAFLCLAAFLSRAAFPGALLEPLNLVALLGFLTTSFVVTRLVSRWRTSFRELQALQDRMGLVIDSIPAWASVIRPDGAVEFVNRWGLEYTGLRFEDTLGSGWKIAVHPDDQAAFASARRKALATGEPFEIETRFRRADGVYRWFLTRVAPLRDEGGGIVRWYGVSADIEDRKVADALLAGEKLLLEMITRGDRLALILDALCRLAEERCSGALCSILLVGPDGTSLRHGAAPSLPGAYVKAIDGVTIGPSAGSCGTAAYRAQPVVVSDIATDPLWADYRALALSHSLRACWSTPMCSSEGRVLGTLAVYYREPRRPTPHERDIVERITHLAAVTVERKQAEEALHQTQIELARVTRVTTLGELTASIAHEVNQPLAAIVADASACLQWLAADRPDLDSVREALAAMVKDGERAADVIGRIRALLSRSRVAPEPCDLAGIVHEVLLLVAPEMGRHGIVLQTALAPELPRVLGDRIQLQQVLLNLLMNAAEAMRETPPERRRVVVRSTVECRDDGTWAVLAVEDAGVGFREQDEARLFEAFYTTKPSGLGMGLSISRSIIERHGGRLWATPNPDHGATFHFALPEAR
ncbi:MAG TPA: ATP-binding protein [Methylomirabilota bacterium]|nr:ATP-binding protein [Methylomirabilota bacterium]